MTRTLRVKIRLESMQAEAKLLRFEEATPFSDLVQMIAQKLGVLEHSNQNDISIFKLYLGDNVLVEDTSEIENLDDLVLKVENREKEEVKEEAGVRQEVREERGVKQEVKEEEPATVSDDTEAEKGTEAAKQKRDDEVVLDGAEHEDKRVAKYYEVPGQQDLVLYFGRVAYFYDDGSDLWEIQYDDGGVENIGLEELEKCLQQARDNRHLDAAAVATKKKKSKSHRESSDYNSDDDDSVEDVTDQMIRDRKKQMEQSTIDISESESDATYSDSEAADDDEDYESHADDLSYADDDSFDGDKKRKATTSSAGERGKRARRPKEPPLEVLMNNKDVPAAPGKRNTEHDDAFEPDDGLQEASTLSGSDGADQTIKDRIVKLLNTGFHDKSNENEAKNAMKLAQRLMRKHNLSQAVLLKERDAKGGNVGDEVLKGGLVEVRIVNRKTKKPSQFARWLACLMQPIAKNFEVDSYYSVSRGYKCSVTFYGIYTNCQLAGYAFRVAAERISQMAAEHKPTKHAWRRVTTKSSRLSYALGIVCGIDNEVDATMQLEKEKRERKLERARLAVSKGEAYDESDDEDDDDGNDGPGFSFPEQHGDNEHGGDDDEDKKPAAVASPSKSDGAAEPSSPPSPAAGASALSGEALNHRVKEMEDEQQNSLVLVNHREKIAKEVLEENDIKVSKGAKRKPISFDRTSYDKGIEDSKEIDINQRAIRDEVKVKKEEY